MTDEMIVDQLISKASKSPCKHKVAAIAFDKKGDLIGRASNICRFSKEGGSIHAEMRLMAQYGANIKTIIICRSNKSGDVLPIHPCKTCKEKADELDIKIVTVCQ